MASETFTLPEWSNGALYLFLSKIFPDHQTPYMRLDVRRLRKELQPPMSHEGVYRWFRSGRLTPKNARALMDLANTPENVEARSRAGKTPAEITIRDFDTFVYPAA